MRRVRKNKAAFLQHMVLLAQRIEVVWEEEEERLDLLSIYRESLMSLEEEADSDLAELGRLGPKMKTLTFSLSHFLTMALPVERKHSRGLRDHEFIVTEHDRQGCVAPPTATSAGGAGAASASAIKTEMPLVNVGSIFRTSECVGVREIVLCGYTATPSDAGTAKAAMGMHELVSWRWERSVEDAVATAKSQGLTVVALETVEGCPEAHSYAFPRGGVALVLGNERHGISPALIKLCDAVVQLPCRGVKNSLNVGTAFGITAYEILRQWETSQ
ncbi:Alpha/beta knot methyltransferase [Baffinella frigidus]|nr:Alpha/beta knot methyltransferase [Cryptophyta sp. CCMP2293]